MRIPSLQIAKTGLHVLATTKIVKTDRLDVNVGDIFAVDSAVGYQLNGQGEVANLPAGAVRGVASGVQLIVFSEKVIVEIMEAR